jgi:hypothetical protein
MAQAVRYREAYERLNSNLLEIEVFYSQPEKGDSHTGDGMPNCKRCSKKKAKIDEAFLEYYTLGNPGSWDEGYPEYREEMRSFLTKPDTTLDAAHDKFKAQLRLHIMRDVCTIVSEDTEETIRFKNSCKQIFEAEAPLADQLGGVFKAKASELDSFDGGPDSERQVEIGNDPFSMDLEPKFNESETTSQLHQFIQCATTPEQYAEIFIAYYCTPGTDDSPQLRALKGKYAKLFESGVSHDEVLNTWRKEARETRQRGLQGLRQKLGDLRMAQSAHLKNKARKKEKDAEMKDSEYVFVPKMEECSLRRCGNQMDVTNDGALECAVCEWLATAQQIRAGERRHFFYCSEEHVEEDFVSFLFCLLQILEPGLSVTG